jgi:hypothetical protein
MSAFSRSCLLSQHLLCHWGGMPVFHALSFSRDVPIQECTTSLMAPFNGSTQKEFEPQREKQVAGLACLTCLNPKEVTPLVTQYHSHSQITSCEVPSALCPLPSDDNRPKSKRETDLLWGPGLAVPPFSVSRFFSSFSFSSFHLSFMPSLKF